jgi:hypothetical protein
MNHLDLATQELAGIEEREKELIALNARKADLRAFALLGAKLFGTQPPAESQPELQAQAATPKARVVTAKAIVEHVAAELLTNSPFVQTGQVLAAAEVAGARIGAADKLLAVSAILSRAPQFQSDRSKGWSLKNEKPESAPTQSGLSAANAA